MKESKKVGAYHIMLNEVLGIQASNIRFGIIRKDIQSI